MILNLRFTLASSSLAFLISKKIATKGIQGKNLLGKAIDILEKQYNNKLEDAVTKDVTKEIDNQLNKI